MVYVKVKGGGKSAGYAAKRKKGRRATPWYNKKYSVGDMAQQAYYGMKYVKSLLNTEQKFFDFVPGPQNVDTTGFVQPLSLVPMGPGAQQRDGRQFKATALHLKLLFELSPAQFRDIIRMVVVRARTDVPPTWALMYSATDTLSMRNLNNVRDYQVIHERIIDLDAGNDQSLQISCDLKLASKVQFAVADVAGNATPEWGNIYIMFLGRFAAGSNPSSVNYYSRLRYVDN